MKHWISVVFFGLYVGGMHSMAWSQERIYRCGNEYTNSAARIKQGGCHLVQGGHVTVVHTQPALPRSSNASAAAPAALSSAGAAQVTASQQRQRDQDARAILQSELAKAEKKLQVLKARYEGGDSEPALRSDIERQEADVASIQRELVRHKGGS